MNKYYKVTNMDKLLEQSVLQRNSHIQDFFFFFNLSERQPVFKMNRQMLKVMLAELTYHLGQFQLISFSSETASL